MRKKIWQGNSSSNSLVVGENNSRGYKLKRHRMRMNRFTRNRVLRGDEIFFARKVGHIGARRMNFSFFFFFLSSPSHYNRGMVERFFVIRPTEIGYIRIIFSLITARTIAVLESRRFLCRRNIKNACY